MAVDGMAVVGMAAVGPTVVGSDVVGINVVGKDVGLIDGDLLGIDVGADVALNNTYRIKMFHMKVL